MVLIDVTGREDKTEQIKKPTVILTVFPDNSSWDSHGKIRRESLETS